MKLFKNGEPTPIFMHHIQLLYKNSRTGKRSAKVKRGLKVLGIARDMINKEFDIDQNIEFFADAFELSGTGLYYIDSGTLNSSTISFDTRSTGFRWQKIGVIRERFKFRFASA